LDYKSGEVRFHITVTAGDFAGAILGSYHQQGCHGAAGLSQLTHSRLMGAEVRHLYSKPAGGEQSGRHASMARDELGVGVD
jgi:hypothetical protein